MRETEGRRKAEAPPAAKAAASSTRERRCMVSVSLLCWFCIVDVMSFGFGGRAPVPKQNTTVQTRSERGQTGTELKCSCWKDPSAASS